MTDATSPSPVPLLRRHLAGVVVADPLAVRVRYVLDPTTGHPVIACRADAGETEDWILFVPDEAEGSLHVAGKAVPLDPDRDGACDRWRAYHGPPGSSRFFRLEVEWARLDNAVFDAQDACAVNRLGPAETRLLKKLNAEPARLRALAARVAGVAVQEAVAVGVDEAGIDIRAWHQIIRADFARAVTGPEEAAAAAEQLLGEAAR